MREALIVWGGWEGHEPGKCAAIIAEMLAQDGFSVRVETETRMFAEPWIHELSLIVPLYTLARIE